MEQERPLDPSIYEDAKESRWEEQFLGGEQCHGRSSTESHLTVELVLAHYYGRQKGTDTVKYEAVTRGDYF